MSTDRDVTRIVRSWLEEGRTTLPDRVLDTVLDQLPATPQRLASWPARRLLEMNIPTRIAVAGATIAAVAVIVVLALPKGVSGPAGQPSQTAAVSQRAIGSQTAGPSPAATPLTLRAGPLVPGTYVGNPVGSVGWTVTVPPGFEGFGHDGLIPSKTGTGPPDGWGFAVLWAGDLYSDPCHGTTGDLDSGSSVDDLVNAIAAQPMYTSSRPIPVTVGGYSGKQIDIQMPSDVDLATCTNNGGDPAVPAGSGGFFVWQAADIGGANVYAQGPGDRFHIRVLDVAGTRVVVFTQDFSGTSPADRATMEALVDSVEFVP
jgi:hypothetical protein